MHVDTNYVGLFQKKGYPKLNGFRNAFSLHFDDICIENPIVFDTKCYTFSCRFFVTAGRFELKLSGVGTTATRLADD